MQLYNSLTKKQEDFIPITDKKALIYSCGPTVYDNLHIGNLSAFIYADILRRALAVNGFSVVHIMNITDIDDKTIKNSKLEFPDKDPKTALKKLTDKYAEIFMNDLSATGNDTTAMQFISAVDTIPEMITLIQTLLDKKIAYIADDGVYFSITKYYKAGHTYGLLQKVATQQSKARILNDEYDKDQASDFALWKKAEEGEPAWDAVFTEDAMTTDMPGRPGWHIECSAMSQKTLGLPYDIHTGGIDLKFPHHENEIAQSLGAGAKQYANYFVHNNHILVDGKKMSKSLKNFYTLRDIQNKGFSPSAFRLLVLESHYSSESNFSWDIMQASENRLKNWQAVIDTKWQLPVNNDVSVLDKIKVSLADNLNTPRAVKEIDTYLDECQKLNAAPGDEVLDGIQQSLGINLTSEDISNEIKDLLEKRAQARAESNWDESDRIRDDLKTKNIGVKDLNDKQIWFRL